MGVLSLLRRREAVADVRPALLAPRDAPGGVALSVRQVHKSFGALAVLNGIDLDIPAGQFVAIVGKSGCGKSTLLRILAGLDVQSEGSVAIGAGFAGQAADEAGRRIMFQEPRLLPWARVRENVEVGLGDGVENAQRRKLGRAALRDEGLSEKEANWPATLSGGQRQRVALARALVSRPRFLALDEPLGALDALTRIEMQALLESVWRREGFTVVLVTHDVSEALALGDDSGAASTTEAGRWCAAMTPPSASTIARLMHCSSSRTLRGHRCRSSARPAPGVKHAPS